MKGLFKCLTGGQKHAFLEQIHERCGQRARCDNAVLLADGPMAPSDLDEGHDTPGDIRRGQRKGDVCHVFLSVIAVFDTTMRTRPTVFGYENMIPIKAHVCNKLIPNFCDVALFGWVLLP